MKKIFNYKKSLNVINEFCNLLNNNKLFSKTTFNPKDFFAFVGKNITKFNYLKKNKVFFYKANRDSFNTFDLPNFFCDGILKNGAISAVSFAKILKFKKIVLIGVDLYNSKYFWLLLTLIDHDSRRFFSKTSNNKTWDYIHHEVMEKD